MGCVDAVLSDAGDIHPQITWDGKHPHVRLERHERDQDIRVRPAHVRPFWRSIDAQEQEIRADGSKQIDPAEETNTG
jgi:hypothetical protein